MAITGGGRLSGSVSGGCVEGAVYDTGLEVLESGRPQLLHFGVADETAWEVGLACGGTIEVFVDRLEPAVYRRRLALADADRPHAVATIIRGPGDWLGRKWVLAADGEPDGASVPAEIRGLMAEAVAGGKTLRRTLPGLDPSAAEVELFVEVIADAPTLVMIGGVHIAVALASMARTVGFRTVIVDPRRSFGSGERFPEVDQLIQAWPGAAFEQVALAPQTAVVMLTHDPKIDDPALDIALNSPALYVGALGSRKTHAARRERLLAAGLTEAQIGRVHGPIGLDIGAETPEEIAVAILAEIIAARRRA
jgi:xanthine dehydrogenase accessory factor